jgi:hypothetical protein
MYQGCIKREYRKMVVYLRIEESYQEELKGHLRYTLDELGMRRSEREVRRVEESKLEILLRSVGNLGLMCVVIWIMRGILETIVKLSCGGYL